MLGGLLLTMILFSVLFYLSSKYSQPCILLCEFSYKSITPQMLSTRLSSLKYRQSQIGDKVLDFVHLLPICSASYGSVIGCPPLLSYRFHLSTGRMGLGRRWGKKVIVQGGLLRVCCQLEEKLFRRAAASAAWEERMGTLLRYGWWSESASTGKAQ